MMVFMLVVLIAISLLNTALIYIHNEGAKRFADKMNMAIEEEVKFQMDERRERA